MKIQFVTLYWFLQMFGEDCLWSFRKVVAHIKCKDFQVFYFALFYFGVLKIRVFEKIITGP